MGCLGDLFSFPDRWVLGGSEDPHGIRTSSRLLLEVLVAAQELRHLPRLPRWSKNHHFQKPVLLLPDHGSDTFFEETFSYQKMDRVPLRRPRLRVRKGEPKAPAPLAISIPPNLQVGHARDERPGVNQRFRVLTAHKAHQALVAFLARMKHVYVQLSTNL